MEVGATASSSEARGIPRAFCAKRMPADETVKLSRPCLQAESQRWMNDKYVKTEDAYRIHRYIKNRTKETNQTKINKPNQNKPK